MERFIAASFYVLALHLSYLTVGRRGDPLGLPAEEEEAEKEILSASCAEEEEAEEEILPASSVEEEKAEEEILSASSAEEEDAEAEITKLHFSIYKRITMGEKRIAKHLFQLSGRYHSTHLIFINCQIIIVCVSGRTHVEFQILFASNSKCIMEQI